MRRKRERISGVLSRGDSTTKFGGESFEHAACVLGVLTSHESWPTGVVVPVFVGVVTHRPRLPKCTAAILTFYTGELFSINYIVSGNSIDLL